MNFELIGCDSYEEAYKKVQHGEADILLSIFDVDDDEREQYIMTSQPYSETTMCMIGKYDKVLPTHPTYALSMRGFINGAVQIAKIENLNWNYRLCDTLEEGIKAVLNNQADCVLMDAEQLQRVLVNSKNKKIGALQMIEQVDLCFGISKTSGIDYERLCSSLNQALQMVDQEKVEEIYISNVVAEEEKPIVDFILHNWIYFLLATILAISIPLVDTIINHVENKARRYREYLFEIISENVNSVVLIYDFKKNKMEYVFENIEDVLGIRPQECMLNPNTVFRCCRFEKNSAYVAAPWESFFLREGEEECFFVNPRTKEEIWIGVSVKKMIDEVGTERYIISITDLTKEKRAKQVLTDALISAKQASAAKTEFLSRVSHEIRTPMNGIIGITSIAENYAGDEDRIKEYLGKISISAKHLMNLINDILDMGQIDSGKMILINEPFVLTEMISNVVTIMMPQIEANQLNFKTDIASVVYENLIGDQLRLEQILINILSNAVKFTPPGGNIYFSINERWENDSNLVLLEFMIEDNGIGMSPEFIEHMFEPFEQENRNNLRTSRGSGLGMSITNQLVTMMNGSINVVSGIDKGTVFHVKVLLEIDEHYKKLSETAQFKNWRVLVVDDERFACENVVVILKNIGVEADWADSGLEALEKAELAEAEQKPYQIYILDWKMPNMDGIETTRQLRKRFGSEPIIMLMAYAWVQAKEQAREAGVNDFIVKPLFQAKLHYALSSLINGNEAKLTYQNSNEIDFTGCTFLVVEDNEMNQEIVEMILNEKGAKVDVANNGQEAIEQFAGSPIGYYDMIFMDIQMPIMDGYEATEKIRTMEREDSDVPIFAMTANAFPSDVAEAFIRGMNGHIAKPIEIDKFFGVIESQLKK